METIIRGVRGSIANPAPDTIFYGGNTVCVELNTDSGATIFFDAGTGLREAGDLLPESGECHIIISHGHMDHMFGLWFFRPIHSPKWITHLYLPSWLENMPDFLYQCAFFPVPFKELRGDVRIHLVSAGATFEIPTPQGSEPIVVEPFAVCHPGGGLGYRVSVDNAMFVYGGDHEITDSPHAHSDAVKSLSGADIAIVDAMYNECDYHPGWGHSRWEDWVDVAQSAGVRNLVLTHHDPVRPDQELDKLDQKFSALESSDSKLKIYVAREGMRFTPKGPIPFTRNGSDWLLVFLERLSQYRDENSILDRILAKAREITHADAGTIYLREGNELVFAYTHNDTLFSADSAHKHIYVNIRMPISEKSIAGYVAATGCPLNIPNIRELPPGVPYSFNDSFDRSSGYFTYSMLVIPFFDKSSEVLGVLQLINSLNPQTKQPCFFNLSMMYNVRLLAREAAGILERSAVERHGIYGILRMAAVHDPSETGPHAERVGSIAAELYQCWAEHAGHIPDDIRYEKGHVRLASMLHDIGKVGISDLILKKPAKLTDEEFMVMRGHTEFGASIMAADPGTIAAYACEIARHHHQKWDGSGYAGSTNEGKLSGSDIPLMARITAIADVFDALVSKRCYKKPWSIEEALLEMKKEAGRHFDPSLIALLPEIRDLITSIYKKFPE
ncbi:hypothetical protein AGMMS50276_30360 [Synergistales bacterium]|nr:hypothetical protein AGMMS50276_30360 [Synergistales bacterium]